MTRNTWGGNIEHLRSRVSRRLYGPMRDGSTLRALLPLYFQMKEASTSLPGIYLWRKHYQVENVTGRLSGHPACPICVGKLQNVWRHLKNLNSDKSPERFLYSMSKKWMRRSQLIICRMSMNSLNLNHYLLYIIILWLIHQGIWLNFGERILQLRY